MGVLIKKIAKKHCPMDRAINTLSGKDWREWWSTAFCLSGLLLFRSSWGHSALICLCPDLSLWCPALKYDLILYTRTLSGLLFVPTQGELTGAPGFSSRRGQLSSSHWRVPPPSSSSSQKKDCSRPLPVPLGMPISCLGWPPLFTWCSISSWIGLQITVWSYGML